MKKRGISKLIKNELFKVMSFSAISTGVKMISNLISIKVIAIYLGPSGVALLGQLMNFNSITVTIANGGIINGVTKYIAEYKNNFNKQKLLIQTSFSITLILSLVVGLILMVFSGTFARLLLKNIEYRSIFIVFGTTIFFFALNRLLIGIINGYKDFKTWVVVNITSSIFSLVFVIVLIYFFKLYGAFLAVVTFQSVVVLITILIVRTRLWFSRIYFKFHFSFILFKKLLAYSAMTLVSVVVVPSTRLLIRTYIIDTISIDDAGIWEGIMRISQVYLLVLTTALSTYYLPVLSEIVNVKQLRAKIIEAYKFIIPVLIVISLSVYFLREFIIYLLFNKGFYRMSDLFIPQLIGDFFKVSSFLLSIQMVAKAKAKLYIYTEMSFGIMLVGLSYLLISKFGILGAVYAYSINYFIYFVVMVFFTRKILFLKT